MAGVPTRLGTSRDCGDFELGVCGVPYRPLRSWRLGVNLPPRSRRVLDAPKIAFPATGRGWGGGMRIGGTSVPIPKGFRREAKGCRAWRQPWKVTRRCGNPNGVGPCRRPVTSIPPRVEARKDGDGRHAGAGQDASPPFLGKRDRSAGWCPNPTPPAEVAPGRNQSRLGTGVGETPSMAAPASV